MKNYYQRSTTLKVLAKTMNLPRNSGSYEGYLVFLHEEVN